jgi:uncharacterized damage-inducible protein DinB
MQPFFADYLNNLQELHNEIRKAIKDLPQAALDWNFGADTNSMSVLIIHLTGAERYWIGDVIFADPSRRDRDAEFKVKDLAEDELLRRLSTTEDYFRKALETLSLQELDETRTSPRNGRGVTVGWALGHALKHTALHLGHIQIMRQLWEQKQLIK